MRGKERNKEDKRKRSATRKIKEREREIKPEGKRDEARGKGKVVY